MNNHMMPVKKKPGRPKKLQSGPKPNLPALDPHAAAKEVEAHAAEGNRKLCMAVDALRSGLETIVAAEMDNTTGLPATAYDLRTLAVEALNAYSQLTGQNWRRVKLSGPTRAGDRNQSTLRDQGYDHQADV
jgi:hypothetical protein